MNQGQPELGVGAHYCVPALLEVEGGGLQIQSHPGQLTDLARPDLRVRKLETHQTLR